MDAAVVDAAADVLAQTPGACGVSVADGSGLPVVALGALGQAPLGAAAFSVALLDRAIRLHDAASGAGGRGPLPTLRVEADDV